MWTKKKKSMAIDRRYTLIYICFIMSFFIFIFIPSVDVMQFEINIKRDVGENVFIYSIRLSWFMGANLVYVTRLRHL